MKTFLLYFFLIFVMITWGINIVVIKVLVTNFPTLTITTLRVLTAFIAILPFIIFQRKIRNIQRRDFLLIVGVSLTTIMGHQYLMSVGLNHTSAINGGLILGTVPIVTSIAAALFLREEFNIQKIIGVTLGFSGVVIILLTGANFSLQISIGDLLFCCTVIVQAIGFILVKKISNSVDILVITGISQFIGGFLLASITAFNEPRGIYELAEANALFWFLMFFSGVIATGLGHYLYNFAIRRLGASKSAVFLNLTPFFSIIGSYLFLNEAILVGHWIGFIFVVAGVLFGTGTIKYIVIRVSFRDIAVHRNKK